MKKLDSIGRITLPKEIRERNHFKPNDLFEVYENGDLIIVKPMRLNYTIDETQINIIRKIYNMIKDTDLLEENEIQTLKEICKCTDLVCPKCNEPLYLSSDNTYKCIKCGD